MEAEISKITVNILSKQWMLKPCTLSAILFDAKCSFRIFTEIIQKNLEGKTRSAKPLLLR